ncbi:hypothetical protein CCACVL1_14194 [Corchorus capsularis]|uniref:Uncharacterized protein n=1 Tax=Corchorus capsularis TaxID=210143 RepID=A0A1R3I7X6_COCAP|nr:hypothetical protein CCACVL1_14194 [Corchorus capsularis]
MGLPALKSVHGPTFVGPQVPPKFRLPTAALTSRKEPSQVDNKRITGPRPSKGKTEKGGKGDHFEKRQVGLWPYPIVVAYPALTYPTNISTIHNQLTTKR